MIVRDNAVVPLTPTADHSGKEGYFVKNSSGNAALCSATTDVPIGVILEGATTSAKDAVALCRGGFKGTVKVKLGATPGTVSAFTLLQLNADGTANADAGTGARTIVAQALEAGTANEKIEAILFSSYTLS